MPRINVLDKKTAELIAAGEVIERPSSVVKELVENAIDAGATTITVEIKNGGVRLMRITDNGYGIDREDVPKAFLRHATSKVQGEEDLYRIATLGFRGEALASVCAVSRVELVTRTPGSPLGYSYHIQGGEGEPLQEIGCPEGTTIYVRDLFYNIPARMKFLKKDVTEGNAIATLLDRLALSHPEVSFRFIREGQEKLHTPGDGNLLSAIYGVYGRDFGETLVAVKGGSAAVQVDGYIVRPESAKASRSMEHFFINSRYVRSVTIMAALEEAYKNSIMTGKFPGCVLNVTLPHSCVDVNVHPAKLEVKLTDERAVFAAVYDACRGGLTAMPQAVAAMDTAPQSVKSKLSYFDLTNKPLEGEQQTMTARQYRERVAVPAGASLNDNSAVKRYMEQLKRKNDAESEPVAEKPTPTASFSGSFAVPAKTLVSPVMELQAPPPPLAVTAIPAFISTQVPDPSSQGEPKPAKEEVEAAAKTEAEPLPLAEEVRLIGEAFSTYLLAQQGERLLLVDKHAAHERILFNKLQAQQLSGTVERQLLLASLRFSFSKELYDLLVGNLALLEKMGFAAEDFGGGSLLLREIPAVLSLAELEDTLLEIAEKLQKGSSRPTLDLWDDMLHTMACKAAVKGGSFTGDLEQKHLLELIQNDPTLRSCPHGRPIMIELSRREIEKMFGRIV